MSALELVCSCLLLPELWVCKPSTFLQYATHEADMILMYILLNAVIFIGFIYTNLYVFILFLYILADCVGLIINKNLAIVHFTLCLITLCNYYVNSKLCKYISNVKL